MAINWQAFSFDSSLSIEGVATACGVVGAAIGYLLSLVGSWRQRRSDRLERGTKFMILWILEREIRHGLSEEQIIAAYASPDAARHRRYYKAFRPKTLTPIEFERILKSLQLERLIELTDVDRYRIRIDRPLWEENELARSERRKTLTQTISIDELVGLAAKAVTDPAIDAYDRDRALRVLAELGTSDALAFVKQRVTSGNTTESIRAIEALAEQFRRY